jgi:hypothetical protein
MELKSKKGSQIGIIMSFSIFIISLMFIFSIISPPTNIDKSKIYSMEILERNVVNNISEEIGIVFINEDAELKDCLSFSTSELGFDYDYFIVKDYSKNEASSGGSVSGMIYINKNSGEENLFSVYFSNYEFDKNLENLNTDCDNAKIYSVLEKKIAIQENIENLIEDYKTNYTKIRSQIGISVADEFNVFFIYENNTKIGTEKENVNTNIFAKTIQIQYLDEKANEKIGELILKVW